MEQWLLGTGGVGSYHLMGTEFQLHTGKSMLWTDGDDDRATMSIYLMPPTCTLKNDDGGKSCVYFATI